MRDFNNKDTLILEQPKYTFLKFLQLFNLMIWTTLGFGVFQNR
jgi:hypothetical protein